MKMAMVYPCSSQGPRGKTHATEQTFKPSSKSLGLQASVQVNEHANKRTVKTKQSNNPTIKIKQASVQSRANKQESKQARQGSDIRNPTHVRGDPTTLPSPPPRLAPVQVGQHAWQERVAQLFGAGPRANRFVRVDRRQRGGMRTGDPQLLRGEDNRQ